MNENITGISQPYTSLRLRALLVFVPARPLVSLVMRNKESSDDT